MNRLFRILPLLFAMLVTISVEAQSSSKAKSSTYRGNVNGHEYVDLGLSVKWATCNVGANSPDEYGDYYAWGETVPRNDLTEVNSVTYGNDSIGCIAGRVEYDVAQAKWGGSWRMPTAEEIEELINNCSALWTRQNAVEGCVFTSNKNGQSIFLPAAGSIIGVEGAYWSATPKNATDAIRLRFYKGRIEVDFEKNRNSAFCIRPVTE